jgi:hypothetical protein
VPGFLFILVATRGFTITIPVGDPASDEDGHD